MIKIKHEDASLIFYDEESQLRTCKIIEDPITTIKDVIGQICEEENIVIQKDDDGYTVDFILPVPALE